METGGEKSGESYYAGTLILFTYKHEGITLSREWFLLLRILTNISITQGTPIHIADLINTLLYTSFGPGSSSIYHHLMRHCTSYLINLDFITLSNACSPSLHLTQLQATFQACLAQIPPLLRRFQQPPTSGLVGHILFELSPWNLKHILRILYIFSYTYF